MTLVYALSTIDECEFLRKSMDTSSSSVTARMPFSLPFAASFSAAFTASPVVFFSTMALRSTSETFGVGTRMAMPSNFPFSSGITSPTALAAPVLVGIIDTAAARARRRSLCGRSSRF